MLKWNLKWKIKLNKSVKLLKIQQKKWRIKWNKAIKIISHITMIAKNEPKIIGE